MLEVDPDNEAEVRSVYEAQGLSAITVGSTSADNGVSISVGGQPSIQGEATVASAVPATLCLQGCSPEGIQLDSQSSRHGPHNLRHTEPAHGVDHCKGAHQDQDCSRRCVGVIHRGLHEGQSRLSRMLAPHQHRLVRRR